MDGYELSKKMKENSYCPYSNFRVGACVEFEDGSLVGGCNVENASYGLTICAERIAICNAISLGKDLKRATNLYIATDSDILTPPCGACLQVMVEFFDDINVILVGTKTHKAYKLSELLPNKFTKDNL